MAYKESTPITSLPPVSTDLAEQLLILGNMTKDEFKKFSKALNVLMESGLNQFQATDLLITAYKNNRR